MTDSPLAVVSIEPAALATPTPVLAYSTVGGSATALRDGLRGLLWVAVGSGLCVGSCFLFFWTEGSIWAVAGPTVLYAAVLLKAVQAGQALIRSDAGELRSAVRTGLDTAAGVGLIVIGLAPAVASAWPDKTDTLSPVAGAAFALMAMTTWRHQMLYAPLGRIFRDAGYGGLARTCFALGWIKFVFEAVWLTCCAVPLMASVLHGVRSGSEDVLVWLMSGALFGCVGYAVIWIVMIVVHVRAVVVARRIGLSQSAGNT